MAQLPAARGLGAEPQRATPQRTDAYLPWLQWLHEGAHGNADLVAHFFRRAYGLLRRHGAFGLIATNTIGQGDTRQTGLANILKADGCIYRAIKRYEWPNEGAAVVVSIVHITKSSWSKKAILDGRQVERISAYLVEGNLDTSPNSLLVNERKAFQASIVLGMGFTFDDIAFEKGESESLATMEGLVAKDPRNGRIVLPYIGGDEVNSSPTHAYRRFVIDFFDRPLGKRVDLKSWTEMNERERARTLTVGLVPLDYPGEVAEDWPDLIEIVERRVKPARLLQYRSALRVRWWQYAEKRPGLYRSVADLHNVFAISRVL